MSFPDFFSRYFNGGFGGNGRPPDNEKGDSFFNKPGDPFWKFPENNMRDFPSGFDFKVITDPVEMHEYVESKLNEIMKSFMSPEMFPGIEGFGLDSPNVPSIEEKQHPRDFYLKPGFDKSSDNELSPGKDQNKKSGSPSSWLESFLAVPEEENSSSQPRVFSSFRSVTRKSVTLPDGTIKTEEIIRNSDGTEEKTESHTLPDGNNPPSFDFKPMNPNFSELFNFNEWPQMKPTTPRNQLLKPGYEKLNPKESKIDKDLDKQILQSGIDVLPSFTKEPDVKEPNQPFLFKSFTRRTVTLPNGIVESEEIVRNPDGSEQRTVTQTQPDGTPLNGSSNTQSSSTHTLDGNYGSALSSTLKGIKDFMGVLFK